MQRITRQELLHTKTSNGVLQQAKEEKLNFPGSGGLQQFIKDFVIRNFKVMGFEHLGLATPYIQKRQGSDDFSEEVKMVLTQIIGVDNVEAVIKAHSQHPASLIANVLTTACPSDQLIITQCPHAEVSIEKENNEIYQIITVPYIPVKIIENNKELFIPGPITAKFKLLANQKNSAPYYQFDVLETSNPLLARMVKGEQVTDKELLAHYDNPQVQALTARLMEQFQAVEKLKNDISSMQAKLAVESQARRGDQQGATQTIQDLQEKLKRLLEQQSRWLREFSELTIDHSAAKAKRLALEENVQRLTSQVERLSDELVLLSQDLHVKNDLLQTQQQKIDHLKVEILDTKNQLELMTNQKQDLAEKNQGLQTQIDDKTSAFNRQANELRYFQEQNGALRNNPYVKAREAQVTDAMITNCIWKLDQYIAHLRKDIPARKLIGYSTDNGFLALARNSHVQNPEGFNHRSLQALRKIRSCLILKDKLLQKDKSNAEKAWDLGMELKGQGHTALLESSRTSALGYALKIVLAPFTAFASIFTYRSKQCKKAQKAMHQLFKPVEEVIDAEIQRQPRLPSR